MPTNRAFRIGVAAICLAVIVCGGIAADGPASVHSAASASCPDPVKARSFEDDFLSTALLIPSGMELEALFCTLTAKNPESGTDNKGQRGVKARLSGQILGPSGNVAATINSSMKTDRAGTDTVAIPSFLLDQAAAVAVDVDLSGSKKLTKAKVECFGTNAPPCEESGTVLCLNDDRFQVEVDWRSSSFGSGRGMVLDAGNNSGSFYFLSPSSQDLLVRLLDNCGSNDHFWVFYAATTTVEYTLTVTDTQTGQQKQYFNPLSQPAPAITDTSAFATCP